MGGGGGGEEAWVMNPKRSGLQPPPGFLIEPRGGSQLRLRVPLVPQKKGPGAGGVCVPAQVFSPILQSP